MVNAILALGFGLVLAFGVIGRSLQPRVGRGAYRAARVPLAERLYCILPLPAVMARPPASLRPFRPEALRKIWTLRDYDLAPDGRSLAYSVNRGTNYVIRVLDLRAGRDRLLFRGEESASHPAWSPDGHTLAFQSDLKGDENHDVYLIPARGGDVVNLTRNPADDAGGQWSPDGSTVAFVSNRDKEVENLFVVPAKGGRARQLTHSTEPVVEFAWRPTGDGLAYVTGLSNNTKLHYVDLGGRTKTLLASPKAEYHLNDWQGAIPRPWSPDGNELAFVTSEHDHQSIGLLHLALGKVQWFAVDEAENFSPQWSPKGDGLLYLQCFEANVRLLYKAMGAKAGTPLGPMGAAKVPAWHPQGRGAVFAHSDPTHPEELFWVPLGGRRRQLTDVVRTQLPTRSLVSPRHIHYRSFDGREIPALLYVPRRPNGAALVVPHGGPEWLSLNDFAEHVQLFTTQGYVVMAPNYRGSTGYGRDYRRISDHDLGGGDLQDVVHAAKYLLEEGLAAADRIGIWGHSYGGYMCLQCLTQAPDLWAVGVSAMGFFNWWTAIAAEREILRKYDREKMGNPDDDPEFFISRSPFFHLNRLRAPLLMFGGTQDPRCPVMEARQVEAKLRAMGVPVEFVEYKDEGHWPQNTDNVVDLLKRSVDFVMRHVPPNGAS